MARCLRSTENYDRGTKFVQYRKLDALREYLLIAQDAPFLEHYGRQEATHFWLLSEASGLEATVELSAIACRLALAEVYAKVEFVEMAH
jgi:Uma2 family endonuclease